MLRLLVRTAIACLAVGALAGCGSTANPAAASPIFSSGANQTTGNPGDNGNLQGRNNPNNVPASSPGHSPKQNRQVRPSGN